MMIIGVRWMSIQPAVGGWLSGWDQYQYTYCSSIFSISIGILFYTYIQYTHSTLLLYTNIYSHVYTKYEEKKLYFPLQIENIITPLLLTVITAYRVQHILWMFYSAVSNIGHNQQTNCASCASISIGNPWQLTNAQWTDGDCRSVSISTIVCWEHSSMAEW